MNRKFNNDRSHKHASRSTQIRVDPETATHRAESLSDHVSTDKGRSTLHGDSYHLRLGLVIMLRAFQMYQEDRDLNFEIVMEDPAGKDFDDIMYRFSSPRLSSVIVRMQAKHKRPEQNKASILEEKMLLSPANSRHSAFSIPKYFLSFLEVEQQPKVETHAYVLCTNASLDENLENSLMVKRNHMEDGLQFCNDIGATCYQINRNTGVKKLEETLITSCAQEMAKHVFKGTVIAFRDSLYCALAFLINKCVKPSVPENIRNSFKFNEEFFNAHTSSPIGQFRKGFSRAYKKLMVDNMLDDTDVIKEVVLKIDIKSFSSALSEGEILVKKLEKFSESFVLICNSLNDDELYRKGIDLLPKWCNSEEVIDRLHKLLFDAMKSAKPIPIDLTYMKKMFIGTNTNCAQLSSTAKEYIKQLRLKYPYIDVDPERLTHSSLVGFLQDVATDGVYSFNSQLDLPVSCLIVVQTLLSFNWETLFVDSTKYEENQDLMNILQDLLSYLSDVNHPTTKLITIVGKPNYISIDTIERLAKKYNQKIVVVRKISENQQMDNEHCDRFSVHDLTPVASSELFKGNEKRMIFGTVTPLSRIVNDLDDLCLLLAMLERCDQSSAINYNLNKCNYEKIKHWYIQRHYEPYEGTQTNGQKGNVAQQITLNRSGLTYFAHEGIPFAKMAKCIDDNKITLSEVRCVLDMNEEDLVPPGFEEAGGGKVFIFLNDAGHGKSSYFTWLAWRLAQQDHNLYVVKLNAMEYSADFERLENIGVQNIDNTGIVRLLYRLVHLALFVPSVQRQTTQETDAQRNKADQCAELLTFLKGEIVLDETMAKELTTEQLIELRLFQAKFNEQQFVLILDGFDEIAPYFKNVVMNFFARVAKFERIRNIYLSSRPCDFEKDFRNTFESCNINGLKPFSRGNVILSLHKLLLKNVDDYKHCEKEQCLYALTVLFAVITEILGDLSTVPLLLYLAQDSLLPVVKEHVNFKLYTISTRMLTNAKLDIMQLVEHFIDRKMHILNTDKSGTTDAAVQTSAAKIKAKQSNKLAKERHVLLAMCVIFDKNDRDKLLSPQEQESVTEFIENVIAGEEKTGIIEGIRDGVPQFVHRIFAEYFAACWLSKNRKRFRNESIFRSQVIWTHSLNKMRDFFNRMILKESEGCDLHWAVLNKSIEQITKILFENPSAIAVQDTAGRYPLHFAQICPMYERLLSKELLCDLGRKIDDLFGWNALDYAFILNDGIAIEYLLKWGVRLDVDILFQQLYSNDIDNLFYQGTNYAFYLECYGKQPDAATAIHTRLVKYLITEQKLDIYSPRDKMQSLSVLEFCATWNVLGMFHQLITQSDQPLPILDDGLVDRLFQLAFERKAHDIISYLVDRCGFSLPSINDKRGLIEGAKRAIEKGQLEMFKTIFQQLCIRYKFVYVEEEGIIDETDAQHENNIIEIRNSFENFCCVLSRNNVILSLPEISLLDDFDSNVDEIVLEFLLTRAIHVGSVQMASYILQKTKTAVTNRLIVTIMRLFPKSQPLCHKKSMSAFRYLLNKTVDLHSVDQEGRNLFHMIAQNGCFYMLPCLIAKGFDPEQVNDLNHWNGFHYLASCTDKFGLRVPQAFAFFLQLGHVDGFATLSTTGESVFDIAIANVHFMAAQMLVQAQYSNLSYVGKVDAVMEITQRMLLKHDAERVLCFIYSLYSNSSSYGIMQDEMWHAVYTPIFNKIPVV